MNKELVHPFGGYKLPSLRPVPTPNNDSHPNENKPLPIPARPVPPSLHPLTENATPPNPPSHNPPNPSSQTGTGSINPGPSKPLVRASSNPAFKDKVLTPQGREPNKANLPNSLPTHQMRVPLHSSEPTTPTTSLTAAALLSPRPVTPFVPLRNPLSKPPPSNSTTHSSTSVPPLKPPPPTPVPQENPPSPSPDQQETEEVEIGQEERDMRRNSVKMGNQRQHSHAGSRQVEAPITAGSRLVETPAAGGQELKLRQEVLKEIFKTEHDYYEDLTVLMEEFYHPIREAEMLEESKINSIFCNIDMIRNISEEFYKRLSDRMNDAESATITIGDVFTDMSHYFSVYKLYCARQPEAKDILVEAQKKNLILQRFLMASANNPRLKGLDIYNYLIKPVQRICKYPLLIRELMKHTPPGHVDYEKLVKAQESIQMLVNAVNEERGKAENTRQVVNISSYVEDCMDIVKPARRFIQEGILRTYSNSGKIQVVIVFLLSDLLVIAKPKNKSYLDPAKRVSACLHLKHKIKLSRARLTTIFVKDDQMPELALNFKLEYKGQQITLITDSNEMKEAWMKTIKERVKELVQARLLKESRQDKDKSKDKEKEKEREKELDPISPRERMSAKAKALLGIHDDSNQSEPRTFSFSETIKGKFGSLALAASPQPRKRAQRASGALSEPSSPRESCDNLFSSSDAVPTIHRHTVDPQQPQQQQHTQQQQSEEPSGPPPLLRSRSVQLSASRPRANLIGSSRGELPPLMVDRDVAAATANDVGDNLTNNEGPGSSRLSMGMQRRQGL